MDANAKVGFEIIKKDPHCQSQNGRLLVGLIERQNLFILNTSELCEGVITRHRKTINGDEKSVIDYIVVCDFLLQYLERMIIDEPRIFVLTKYAKRTKTESDHNLLFAVVSKTKREIFNFKNSECQTKFFEVTENTTKLSSCFQSTDGFEKQTKCFL